MWGNEPIQPLTSVVYIWGIYWATVNKGTKTGWSQVAVGRGVQEFEANDPRRGEAEVNKANQTARAHFPVSRIRVDWLGPHT